MKIRLQVAVSLAVALLISACSQEPVVPGGLEPQFGSPRDDTSNIVATDAQRGHVYLASNTSGPYDENGTLSRGEVLVFRRYNRDGSDAWRVVANFETPNVLASATGTDIDGAGNVYFGWNKTRVDPNETVAAVTTGFISKYSPTGTRLLQVSLRDVEVTGLSSDPAGNIYVTGTSRASRQAGPFPYPFFVRKYSSLGKLVWEHVVTAAEVFEVISLDDIEYALDGLYVGASDFSDLGILLKRRSGNGTLVRRSYGNGDALDIAVSGTSVYLLSQVPGERFYLQKFRADGSVVWERPGLGSSGDDRYESVGQRGLGVDAQGAVYLTGSFSTYQYQPDGSSELDSDLLVRKYTSAGNVVFNKQFKVPETDAFGSALAVATASELYVVGHTTGKVNGSNNGGQDAFLTRLNAQGGRVWER